MKLSIRRARVLVVALLLAAGSSARAADEEPNRPKYRSIATCRDTELLTSGPSKVTSTRFHRRFDHAGLGGEGASVWKKRYDARKAMNAGIGGDRTQHVLWRLDNGNVENLSPSWQCS